jgi:NADPH oxidase
MNINNRTPLHLKKLYIFWISREADNFSWFNELLSSLEETCREVVEINTFVSRKLSTKDIYNIAFSNQSIKDPVTDLITPCQYGRPHWVKIFGDIRSKCTYRSGEGTLKIGVFFCGPLALAKELNEECIMSSDQQVEFVLRLEIF